MALEGLASEHEAAQRSFRLVCVAGAWQVVTQPEFAPWLRVLLGLKPRPPRLSQAALETLAIIAYRQPMTRAEIDPSSTPKSGCSYEVKFRLPNGCNGCAAQEFRAEAKEDFFVSAQHAMAPSPEVSKLDAESSLLPRGWQFHWRTALAPRAPSFHA